MKPSSHVRPAFSRRDFLLRTGGGFGAVAASYMLELDSFKARAANMSGNAVDPLASHPGDHPATAKSVIFLFMEGGPSHVDLFDPKPELLRLAGQPMPASFGRPITAMGTANNTLMPTKRTFKRHGKSGIWVSDWLPRIASQVDEIAVLNSCWANGLNHVGSVCQMNTGDILAGRPSLGAWTTYGLGSANENLPTFVVMSDAAEPLGGPKNWSSGFLPASFQGTAFRSGNSPIFDLAPPHGVTENQQRSKLDLLSRLNQHYAADKEEDTELAARLNSYELAYRMQASAPEAVDIGRETEATREVYGIGDEETRKFGSMCLVARRLVERGVRFVELYCGSGSAWDAHADVEENHSKRCRASDKPVAGLLRDLKARGLLDDTLVVWGGEFGRTPFNEKGKGRDHNPWGFTMWFAGGGIKPGTVVGATDEIGLRAVQNPCHVHDIHSTILHCLGLNSDKLTFLHNGRNERPTINDGHVISELLA